MPLKLVIIVYEEKTKVNTPPSTTTFSVHQFLQSFNIIVFFPLLYIIFYPRAVVWLNYDWTDKGLSWNTVGPGLL